MTVTKKKRERLRVKPNRPTLEMHKNLAKLFLKTKKQLMEMLVFYENDHPMWNTIYAMLDDVAESRNAMVELLIEDHLVRKRDVRGRDLLDKIYFPTRPK